MCRVLRSLAWTDEAYLSIDAAQYSSDSGPCLEAARTRQPVRASTTEHREQLLETLTAGWRGLARASGRVLP